MTKEKKMFSLPRGAVTVIKIWMIVIYVVALYVGSASLEDSWSVFEYGRF